MSDFITVAVAVAPFVAVGVIVCAVAYVWCRLIPLGGAAIEATDPDHDPSSLDVHWTDVRDLIDADQARATRDEVAVARAGLMARIIEIRCGILAAELSDDRAVAEWLSDGAR